MATPVELPFPREEYQQRLSGVQQRLRSWDLDVLLCYTPENIYYLTGYNTTGYYVYQCLLVPTDHDPIMVTRRLELGNVTAGTWLDHWRTFGDTEDPVEVTPAELHPRVREDASRVAAEQPAAEPRRSSADPTVEGTANGPADGPVDGVE